MSRDGRHLAADGELGLTAGPVEWGSIDGDEDRSPLLLLHEGLGCVAMWRAWPHLLAEATGRRVVAYSRHGYGGSGPTRLPRPTGFLQTEALEVLPEVVDRLGLGTPILVGHSDGASIALVAGAAHSVDCTAVVAVAPHILVEQLTVDAIAAIRERFLADGDLRARLGRYHRDADMAFWGWNDVWLSSGFRTWTIEPLLRRLRAPVVTIQGGADPYGSTYHVDAIDREVRGTHTSHVLADVGHAPHLERPVETTAAVAAALADLP